MIRVAIIAPILAMRAGLRSLLGATPVGVRVSEEDEIEVVLEAAQLDGINIDEQQIDLLVFHDEAISFTTQLSKPEILQASFAILIITSDPNNVVGLADLHLRAWGILNADITGEELIASVRALDQGQIVGAPAMISAAFENQSVRAPDDLFPLVVDLTDRESQVLQNLALGMANKQIALVLNISEHTVKFHISSIYGKLGVTNRTEAVRQGLLRGLIAL